MAQRINQLELYAGLDIPCRATGVEASLHHAVSRFFNKLEAAISQLPHRASIEPKLTK